MKSNWREPEPDKIESTILTKEEAGRYKETRPLWNWFEGLKRLEIYPENSKRMWKSPQCDGCFAVMHPLDIVPEWAQNHYSHRAEILEPLLPDYEHSLWDNKSIHVREEFIRNSNFEVVQFFDVGKMKEA